MKSFPLDLSDELAKEECQICHLFVLELDSGTYRFTDYSMDIYDEGNWYYSRGIEFDGASSSISPKVDSMRSQMDDVDQFFSSIMMSEEIRNKQYTVYKAAINNNLQVVGKSFFFLGFINSGDLEEETNRASLDIYNHFIRWKLQTPRRQHEPNCRYTFKDSETCKYAGSETWCDHSWERCIALGNNANNPAFRFLLSLQNKQIWWGRIPK